MSPHTTSGSLPVFDSSLIRQYTFPNALQIRESLNNTNGLCIPIKARIVDTVKSTTLKNTKHGLVNETVMRERVTETETEAVNELRF